MGNHTYGENNTAFWWGPENCKLHVLQRSIPILLKEFFKMVLKLFILYHFAILYSKETSLTQYAQYTREKTIEWNDGNIVTAIS